MEKPEFPFPFWFPLIFRSLGWFSSWLRINFMHSHPAQHQCLLELLGFRHTPPAVGYILSWIFLRIFCRFLPPLVQTGQQRYKNNKKQNKTCALKSLSCPLCLCLGPCQIPGTGTRMFLLRMFCRFSSDHHLDSINVSVNFNLFLKIIQQPHPFSSEAAVLIMSHLQALVRLFVLLKVKKEAEHLGALVLSCSKNSAALTLFTLQVFSSPSPIQSWRRGTHLVQLCHKTSTGLFHSTGGFSILKRKLH